MAFEWPWEHTSFPPFFTLQVNAETRGQQVESWCSLILQYTRHNRLDALTVDEALTSPLFHNKKLNRRVAKEFALVLLDELASRGNVEWLGGAKDRCLIMWRSPAEWAAIVDKWARDNGYTNTVCTLYELTEGETGEGQEFFGLDKTILRKALAVLQKEGKAEVFSDGDDGSSDGVKFF